MIRFLGFLVLMAAAATLNAQPAQLASLDLLRRAADLNPGLRSYTASAELSATLHALVPVHRTFTGDVYYLEPNRRIEFQNVSGPLSRFKDLASSTPSYDQLTTDYVVTPLTDTGTLSNFSLVPKKADSRVQKLTVTIDDASAIVRHAQWRYVNGGTLDLDQNYVMVGSFQLPATANIAARFPGYSVDGTISFSNYKPNAPVSPSIFASH